MFDKNKLNAAPFWKQDDNADYAFDLDYASTTLVGQFPEGNTPDGLSDLSGNAWELTDSRYENGRVNRVLCGGSWGDDRRSVRCAYRVRFVPAGFGNLLGFCVVRPGSDPGC